MVQLNTAVIAVVALNAAAVLAAPTPEPKLPKFSLSKGKSTTSKTEKIGTVIDAAQLGVSVANAAQGKRELIARNKSKAPAKAPKPPAPKKNDRPHSSTTEKINTVIGGGQLAVDAANMAQGKRELVARTKSKAPKAPKAPPKPKPAPKNSNRPKSSTTEKIGTAIDGAQLGVDVANMVQGKRELIARNKSKAPAKAPKPPAPKKNDRPHSSTTEKINTVIGGGQLAVDVANMAQGKRELVARTKSKAPKAPKAPKPPKSKPAPKKDSNRPKSSKTEKIGTAVDAAQLGVDVANMAQGKREFFDLEEREFYEYDMDELD